jgi:hypothetical protein
MVCACKAAGGPRLLLWVAEKNNRLDKPESGAATERFLALQHERGRRAALGPSAIDTQISCQRLARTRDGLMTPLTISRRSPSK